MYFVYLFFVGMAIGLLLLGVKALWRHIQYRRETARFIEEDRLSDEYDQMLMLYGERVINHYDVQ
jgi:hypothetical protein